MNRRAWLGMGMWLVLGTGLASLAVDQARAHAEPIGKLTRYLFSSPERVEAKLTGPLRVGDPVLDGDRRYMGSVAALPDGMDSLSAGESASVTLAIDPEVLVPEGAAFYTNTAPVDASWVLETLLPEAKREFVISELEAFVDAHEDEITAVIRPMAEDTIQHGMEVLEANLKEALQKRDHEIQALLDKHRAKVKDDLLPVLKRELGPTAKKKAEPILEEIGRELWQELPMWSVGWRAFVDTIPGTSKDRTQRWWREFVDTKAIPILSAHEGDLVKALEELIEEGARNPEVRKALGEATRRLAADPEFKKVVRGILEDSLVRPFQIRTLARTLLNDPAHQQRLRDLQRTFGPTLKRIARRLTTDESGAIDPDLARVLRRVVFRKDARWVEVVIPLPSDEAPPSEAPPEREFK